MSKKTYTIKDIQKAGFNLEPTICRNCKDDKAFFNFGLSCVVCENCGLIDDGGHIKRQLKEQEIKDLRNKKDWESIKEYAKHYREPIRDIKGFNKLLKEMGEIKENQFVTRNKIAELLGYK